MTQLSKLIFFISIFISLTCQSVIIERVIDSDGNVKNEILDLLAHTNPEIKLPNRNLESLVPPTQKHWLRQGQKRWEQIDLDDDDTDLSQKIETALIATKLKKPVRPKKTNHTAIATFGGTTEAMTVRIARIRDFVKDNAYTGKIYLIGSSTDCSEYLTGVRTLIADHPTWFPNNQELPGKLTETGLLSFLAENFIKPLRENYDVIDMQDISVSEQETRKAYASDQALKLRELIEEGTVLFFSSDDIGIRHGVIVETIIPKDNLDLDIFHGGYPEIRTAFQAAGNRGLSSRLALDNLARLLYQIHVSTK